MNGKRFYWDYMGRFFSMTKPNAIAFFKQVIEDTKAYATCEEDSWYSADVIIENPKKYGKCLSEKTSCKLRKEFRADLTGGFNLGEAEFWVEFLSR